MAHKRKNNPRAEAERRARKRDKRRSEQLHVDCLCVGDGAEPGQALRIAEDYIAEAATSGKPPEQARKVAVVQPESLTYDLPPNMRVIQMDAMDYFEGKSSVIDEVHDNFAFDHVCFRILTADPDEQERLEGELFSQYAAAGGVREKMPRQLLDLEKNQKKFIRSVKKALSPGGKWVLITSTEEKAEDIGRLLRIEEFDVTRRELTPEEVRESGSKTALKFMDNENKIYEITAVKPLEEDGA